MAKDVVASGSDVRVVQDTQTPGFTEAGFDLKAQKPPEEAPIGRADQGPLDQPTLPSDTTQQQYDQAYTFAQGKEPVYKQPEQLPQEQPKEPAVVVDSEQARAVTEQNAQELTATQKQQEQIALDKEAAQQQAMMDFQKQQQQQREQPPTAQVYEPQTPEQQQQQEAEDYFANQAKVLDQELNTTLKMLDDRKATLDARNKANISQIQNSYMARKQQMDMINQSALNSQKIAGIRSGRQRYATEIQTSILSEEERAGLSRLAQLDREEQQMLQQAQAAYDEEDWGLLNARMQAVKQGRQEKDALMQQQAAMAAQQEEIMIQKAKEAREQEQWEMDAQMKLADFNMKQQDYMQKQEDRIGSFLANSLVSLGDGFNVVTPSAEELNQLAEQANINPIVLQGMVQARAEEMNKMSLEERQFALSQVKAEADLTMQQWDLEEKQQLLPMKLAQMGLSLESEQFNLDRGKAMLELDMTAKDIANRGALLGLDEQQIKNLQAELQLNRDQNLSQYDTAKVLAELDAKDADLTKTMAEIASINANTDMTVEEKTAKVKQIYAELAEKEAEKAASDPNGVNGYVYLDEKTQKFVDQTPEAQALRSGTTLLDSVDEYLTFINDVGSAQTKETRDKAVRLQSAIAMQLKTLWGMGALSESEYNRLDAAIPNVSASKLPHPFLVSSAKTQLSEMKAQIESTTEQQYKQLLSRDPKYQYSPWIQTTFGSQYPWFDKYRQVATTPSLPKDFNSFISGASEADESTLNVLDYLSSLPEMKDASMEDVYSYVLENGGPKKFADIMNKQASATTSGLFTSAFNMPGGGGFKPDLSTSIKGSQAAGLQITSSFKTGASETTRKVAALQQQMKIKSYIMRQQMSTQMESARIKAAEILKKRQESLQQQATSKSNERMPAKDAALGANFAAGYKEGQWGGQCGSFSHNFVDFPPMGNTFQEKVASINKRGILKKDWTPKVGDVVISNGTDVTASGKPNTWGHVSVVMGIEPDGTLIMIESNRRGDEKITMGRKMSPNFPGIYGAFRGPIKNKWLASESQIAQYGSQQQSAKGPTIRTNLGSLSEKYESGGNPGAVGYDRTGGWSYGKYQLAHNNAKSFVEQSPYAKQFKGLTFNSDAWRNRWKQVAKNDPQGFAQAQHEYIAKTHFDPQVKKLAKSGIDLNKYHKAVQDAVWSTAVQHGANTDVIVKAINKVGKNASPAAILKAIYNERWAGGSRFAASTKAVKNSVYNRFFGKNGELNTALAML